MTPLWPHQVEGIEFARDKKAVYIDGWMGVGKTRQKDQTPTSE